MALYKMTRRSPTLSPKYVEAKSLPEAVRLYEAWDNDYDVLDMAELVSDRDVLREDLSGAIVRNEREQILRYTETCAGLWQPAPAAAIHCLANGVRSGEHYSRVVSVTVPHYETLREDDASFEGKPASVNEEDQENG